jgi:hypothetical protein
MSAAALPTSQVVEQLVSRLCETAFVHELAACRLRSDACRRTVTGAARWYRQQCQVLGRLTAGLGRPVNVPSRPGLARRWRLRWALLGSDAAVMRRLLLGHTALAAAQTSALGEVDLEAEVRAAIERQRQDLKRVGAWLAYRESELSGRRHGRLRARSATVAGAEVSWAEAGAAAHSAE